ncbi:MAG: NAD(P)/FAD-dependent oxidoreductase [Candidatus Paceibacterota bacterium]|jgi:thioredoxin reductase (NADPH)
MVNLDQVQDKIYDLLIVGAGPAGIEAALQAKKAGMNALLIDREEAGFIIAHTMSNKKFYHAYGQNVEAPKGLLDFPDRKQGSELVRLWRLQADTVPYAPHTVFKTIEDARGETSGKGGGLASDTVYNFITDKGAIQAPKLILATGMFSKPCKLGVPGEEGNTSVAHEFDYNSFITDKKILVIGGGNSAVEAALELSLDNEVTLLVRKPHVAETVTERNRVELENEAGKGTIKVFYNSSVTEFNNQEATLKLEDKIEKKVFDKIYITIGFEKPSDWLASMSIALDQDGLPKLSDKLETSRSGIFVSGALTGNDSIIGSANQSIDIIRYMAYTAKSA